MDGNSGLTLHDAASESSDATVPISSMTPEDAAEAVCAIVCAGASFTALTEVAARGSAAVVVDFIATELEWRGSRIVRLRAHGATVRGPSTNTQNMDVVQGGNDPARIEQVKSGLQALGRSPSGEIRRVLLIEDAGSLGPGLLSNIACMPALDSPVLPIQIIAVGDPSCWERMHSERNEPAWSRVGTPIVLPGPAANLLPDASQPTPMPSPPQAKAAADVPRLAAPATAPASVFAALPEARAGEPIRLAGPPRAADPDIDEDRGRRRWGTGATLLLGIVLGMFAWSHRDTIAHIIAAPDMKTAAAAVGWTGPVAEPTRMLPGSTPGPAFEYTPPLPAPRLASDTAPRPPAAPASVPATSAPVAAPVTPPAPAPVATAATEPSAPVWPTVVSAVPGPSVATATALIAQHRGDDMLKLHDVSSARRYFELAADGGSAEAALALGRTFDTAWLADSGAVTIAPDDALAGRWYARAAAMGSTEAAALLHQRNGDAK